jgi:(S)-citramalyl-CoA lyase
LAKPTHPHVEQMVRVNALSTLGGLKGLQAIIENQAPPPAIMIPKVRSAEEVQLPDQLLIGRAAAIRFCAIIETNEGLERVRQIARASPRIDSLIIGAVDVSADLRRTKTREPLLYARSRIVHAAASTGIDALDVPFLSLEDETGLREEAMASARLGFTGKASVHANQLAAIHAAFSPGEKAVARARKIIAAFEKDTTGLLVVDCELIELPAVRSMYRVLAIAGRIGSRPA